CAMTANGALRCWGSNGSGQTTIPRDPLRVIEIVPPDLRHSVYLPLLQR
ncbi:MAG: hypothetical protein EOM24_37860, partial [Chloroflexia bacterium]|nr:hypothetical protein [Chloroflexia bacterium]